jgi:glycine oxidase
VAEDCLILGGGVIGLSLAYELAGAGASVHVVERGTTGREASWAGAGILPPGNITDPQTADERLIRLCHDLHPRWSAQLREETGIDNEYRRTGGLYLARTAEEATAVRQQGHKWRDLGISVEFPTASQLRDIEPALAWAKTDSENAESENDDALFAPDEAQLRNPRHLRALRAACAARGVRLTEGESVEDFEIAGKRVTGVRTAANRHVAGAICVTGGAWSKAALARLGTTIALKPIRGQIALLQAPAKLLRRVINDGKRYLVPRADGRVLVGSTEEDVGFLKRTTVEAIGELLRFAGELVPGLQQATLETSWAGLRPMTPDERPYLGRVPDFENAFVAAGHFRAGLQLSPGTAVIMRQAMLGQPIELELAAFRVDRG